MAEYGKPTSESRKTSPLDNFSQLQELENLDIFNTYWAKIIDVSTQNYDEYTVSVFADETVQSSIADGIKAYSVDLKKYLANDIVKVYWRPASQFALIYNRSLFNWIKLTSDWLPNNAWIEGQEANQLGTLRNPSADPIRVSLTGSGYRVAYCPFKKNDVVAYFKWPYSIPSTWSQGTGIYDGVVINFPQIPIPSALHQVLVCSGAVGSNFRVSWGYVRTTDRLDDANPEAIPQDDDLFS